MCQLIEKKKQLMCSLHPKFPFTLSASSVCVMPHLNASKYVLDWCWISVVNMYSESHFQLLMKVHPSSTPPVRSTWQNPSVNHIPKPWNLKMWRCDPHLPSINNSSVRVMLAPPSMTFKQFGHLYFSGCKALFPGWNVCFLQTACSLMLKGLILLSC